MSIASEIREFVTENMDDVGKFTTKDVATMCEDRWPSSNISVALHDWAAYNWIVGGYRLTKEGKKGGRQTWEVVTASKSKPKQKATVQEDYDVFAAEVLDQRSDGTLIVRTSGGDFYKVQRLEW
jgi:hypothetical protein